MKGNNRSIHRCMTILVGVALLTLGCNPGKERLLIGAASSFYDLAIAIRPDLETAAALPIDFTFVSTGVLQNQLQAGAPMDLILSAGDIHGVHAINRCIVAYGRLTLWTRPQHNPAIRDLNDLVRSSIHQIAVADPRFAPYGKAAIASLKSSGLLDRLTPKLLVVDNARRAFLYARDGQVDAGFTAVSLVHTTGRSGYIVPPDLYPPIHQIAMIPVSTRHPRAARKLLHILCSPDMARFLQQFGFLPVNGI